MPAKSKKKDTTLWGFKTDSLLVQLTQNKAEGRRATVHVDLNRKAPFAHKLVEGEEQITLYLHPLSAKEIEHEARLKTAALSRVRDAVGASLGQLEKMDVGSVEYHFQLDAPALEAALLGLEIALYRFKRVFKEEPLKMSLRLLSRGKSIPLATLEKATSRGVAVNLARHLINLPPNLLNPVSYAKAVERLFEGAKGVQVEVWDEERLKKERCNLLLAVGLASATPPRLVHIRYRPSSAKKAPIAFVGKGITFDSGGLDIKPSSGMRLMKKDMGGSAAVLALAYWAAETQLKVPLDFYLSMAENAIGSHAFRPSDLFTSRSGSLVEIHNTDAEGRLVLADAMDVAITQKEKPRALVDVATLTGAIKVALGASLTGLFSNDGRLATAISTASQRAGDLTWIMPLFEKYRSQLNSIFADQVNSVDGFGGAITAALFLEKFAGDIPWAHLDIYAWKDSSEGAWLESGGSGQAVLGLAEWLRGVH